MLPVKQIHTCNNVAFGGGKEGRERQERLYDSRIAVIGADVLGQMVLSMLACLGVGNIYSFDNSVSVDNQDRGFLYDRSRSIIGKKRSSLVREEIAKINPGAGIIARHGEFCSAFIYGFNPDMLIDTTNNPGMKKKALEYALSSNKAIPFISLSSDEGRAAMSVYHPRNKGRISVFPEEPDLEALMHEEFTGREQGGFTSCFIAGLAGEEVRKHAFMYDGRDKHLRNNHPLVYNIHSASRSGIESDLRINRVPRYRAKKVLVAGCGALGNFVEICLAYLGLRRVDFIDYDTVEEKNLNRQLEFRGRINEKKSKVLSERIMQLDPYVKSDFYDAKIGYMRECILLEKGYDVILGCLDNKEARVWLNEFAVIHGIPYIDGGTHPKEGQAAVYIPSVTESIGKQLTLSSFPEKSNACSGPNPSVVMSNAVIASAMVGELVHVLDYPLNKPLSGRFNYSTMLPQRFYVGKAV